MSNKKKAPPADRAVPTITQSKKTDVEKVQVTRTTSQTMQQSPDWATATALQAAVKAWNANADAIEANAKVMSNLAAQHVVATAQQRSLRSDWATSTKQVLTAVEVVCAGSADRVKAFGLGALAHQTAIAQGEIAGLTVNPGKVTGDVAVAWLKGTARHGYVVQHATDPNTPATFSAVMPWTKVKYTLSGVPTGTNVYFRVAAVDPTSKSGMSPWTAWVCGNAR